MAIPGRELLRQVKGKQRDSHAILQDRSELQSLHFDGGNNYTNTVNVNGP